MTFAEGDWWFDWPPSSQTITQTVAQVDRMTRRGLPISWFRLGDEHGDFVVSDYVKS